MDPLLAADMGGDEDEDAMLAADLAGGDEDGSGDDDSDSSSNGDGEGDGDDSDGGDDKEAEAKDNKGDGKADGESKPAKGEAEDWLGDTLADVMLEDEDVGGDDAEGDGDEADGDDDDSDDDEEGDGDGEDEEDAEAETGAEAAEAGAEEAKQAKRGRRKKTAEEGADPPEKKKRGKPKDPHAPAKPTMPFYTFSNMTRPQLLDKRPELKGDMGGIGRALSEEWKGVPQEEKDKMQEEYDVKKAEYDRLFAEYRKTEQYKTFQIELRVWKDGREVKKLLKRHKAGAPARPKSGYMRFGQDAREDILASNKGISLSEIGKLVSQRWAEAGEKVQAKCNAECAKEKEVYDVEFAKYKRSEAYHKATDELAQLEIKQGLRRLKTEYENLLPKRPPGAAKVWADKVGIRGGFADIGAKYKALSAEEQAPINEELEKLKAQSKEACDAFAASAAGIKYKKLEASVRQKAIVRAARKKFLVDAPKRAPSAQVLFANSGNGGTWARISETEKKQWEREHERLTEDYESKMKTFQTSDSYKKFEKTCTKALGRSSKRSGKKKSASKKVKKVKKDKLKKKSSDRCKAPTPEGMPAKSQSGFQLFAKDKGGGVRESAKNWAAASDEEKKPYLAQAQRLAKERADAVAQWQKSAAGKKHAKAQERAKEAKKKNTREQKAKEKFLKGTDAPETPARPKKAKALFVEEKRTELMATDPSMKTKAVDKKAAEMWDALGDDGRKAWLDKERAYKDAYEFDMEAYRETPAYKAYQKASAGKGKKGAKGAKPDEGGARGGGKKRKKDDDDDLMFSDSDMGDSMDSIGGLVME